MLIELITCAFPCVEYFRLTSESDFFGEAVSMIDSRFAFRVMFGDWSVNRIFRPVLKN